MSTLNDSILIQTIAYPDGQIGVLRSQGVDYNLWESVVCRLEYPGDLLRMLAISELWSARRRSSMTLCIPYFPARQDRADADQVFTLRPLCKAILSMGFGLIQTIDPHSDVLAALLPDLSVVSQRSVVGDWPELGREMERPAVVVAPDAGAAKKLASWVPNLIHASKCRNPATGEVGGFEVYGDVTERCVIVDDICDGGATFVGLARVLRDRGAKDISLYVTHGIFSKGQRHMLSPQGPIDRIYTTNTWRSGRDMTRQERFFVKEVV